MEDKMIYSKKINSKFIIEIFMYFFCITFIISYWNIPFGSVIRYIDLIIVQSFAIFDIIKNKKYKEIYKNKRSFLSIIIMILLMFVSICASSYIKESIIKTISIVDLLLVVLCVFPLILKKFTLDEILKIVNNSIFIILALSTIIFRDSYSFSGDSNRVGKNLRFLAGFIYPSILGNFASIEIFITIKFIYSYVEDKINRKERELKDIILYLIQIILPLYLIYASNTRTAGCVVSIFIFILLYKMKFKVKTKKIIKYSCLLLMVFIIILILSDIITFSLIDNILSYRLTLMQSAFEELIDSNSLLFGRGAFRNSSMDKVGAILIDNGYINFIYQYGIIASIPLLMFLLNMFRNLKELEKSNLKKDVIFIETFFISFLIYSLFENSLLNISSFLAIVTYTLVNIILNKEILESNDEEIMIEENINNENKVAILMATYNGEKYLEEQIESILDQTYKDFILYIRDDNSTDNTNKIIDEYVEKYPEKIVKVNDERVAKGACNNFMYLLEHVYKLNKYEIFMFSDQDDVWLEDKVKVTVNEYNKLNNKERPILMHTDLKVVDSQLHTINESFLEYSNLNGEYDKFNNYLIQNNVTGCTMLINKRLVDLVKFDISNLCMHDWYFALIASAFGQAIYKNYATIKYRQHGSNVLGAKKGKGLKRIYDKLIKDNTIKEDLNKVFKQAENFKEIYYDLLDEEYKKIIDDFCKIPKVNKIRKIIIICKNRFYKHSISRIIGEIIFI